MRRSPSLDSFCGYVIEEIEPQSTHRKREALSNEKTPYHRVAKFAGEREAGTVYFKIRELIETPKCDLSAYRFLIQGIWHVAIVGETPSSELADQLERELSIGERVEISVGILDFLQGRRQEQIENGPWVERHHRPGQRFRLGPEVVADSDEDRVRPLFPLGHVVMTANLQAKLREVNHEGWEAELVGLISRHASGDWGDLDEDDKGQNYLALGRRLRIFSAYETGAGVKIWIITEADRSVTTALLPEDY